MRYVGYHLIAITLAIFIDLVVGDPPTWPHPVKWMGRAIAKLDHKLNKGDEQTRKVTGLIMLFLIVFSTLLISIFIVWLMYEVHLLVGIIVEGVLIAATISQRGLRKAALKVYHALKQGDLAKGRMMLSQIVGRDTDNLDESEIVRGTVETVSENISDGVTAPLFWAFIGGAPLALCYRAINTCDSMVGYQNKTYQAFGWASAKMDDLVNWIPSRITGLMIILGNKPKHMTRKAALHLFVHDAKKHPSPNSGWLEASVAAILGIQLGGINYYKGVVSERAKMGEPIVPLESKHIQATNQLLHKTCFLFVLFLWVGGIIIELAKTWL